MNKLPLPEEVRDFEVAYQDHDFRLNMRRVEIDELLDGSQIIDADKEKNYLIAAYLFDETELKTAISGNATDGGSVEHQSTSATAKQAVTVTGSDNDTTKKNVIVNSIRIADLDNKNRITSYYGFKNSDANRSYYVKVYSYVIADNQVTLSETPVVINLNDIGTKTYAPQQ